MGPFIFCHCQNRAAILGQSRNNGMAGYGFQNRFTSQNSGNDE